MAFRKRPIAAGFAALVFSSWVSALGLGELKLHSSLNEPLDAEVEILNAGDLSETELIAGLASRDAFERAGVERELILTGLSFAVDMATPGKPRLLVTTKKPIREPYLDFLVELQWPSGRLLREYTVLLDLPVYAGGKAKAVALPSEGQPQPGQSPASSTGQAPQPTIPLASGEEYRVRDGDTLWRIASRLSASDISVNQKMDAILRLNPEAFVDGDINRLLAGRVLRLPDYGDFTEAQPAAMELATEDPSSTSLQADAAPADEAPEQDATEASETTAATGRLRLSAIDPNTTDDDDTGAPGARTVTEGDLSGGLAIQNELATIQEEMSRTQRENAELKMRLGNLEEQLATMRKLVELNDGAALAAADDTASGSENKVTAEEKAAGQQKSEKGWFDTVSSYLSYLIGFLVVLIAAVIFIVLRKRRSDDRDDEPTFESLVPPAPARKPPETVASTDVSSLDEIELDEGDDLFAPDEPQVREKAPETPASRAEPAVEVPPSGVEKTPDEGLEDVELDLSEFDLQEPESPVSSPDQAQTSDEPLNLDDEFDFLGDADEVDTQLELAQAYIDMGDNAGAKEILEEVLEGGNDEQKDRASALLSKITRS
ncbi:MAG: hypothetical protein CMK32_13355 [Porticoccaceae bacterium]|nr:hypothetical protein [Porticoccaceae bacterium]